MRHEDVANLLKAKRSDFTDGFPMLAAIKALTAEGSITFKRDYLNQLLEKHKIEVVIKRDKGNSFFSEHGIVEASTDSMGYIEIAVSSKFFSKLAEPFKQAIRFQSIVTHELAHRAQLSSGALTSKPFKSDESLNNSEYLNDPFELKAMAAEVIHDLSTQNVLGATNLIDYSPRLEYLTTYAGLLSDESIRLFQHELSENSDFSS